MIDFQVSIARLTEAIYIRYKDSQSRLPFLVVPASILALVSFVGILLNASLLYVTVKGKFVIDFFDFLSTDNAGGNWEWCEKREDKSIRPFLQVFIKKRPILLGNLLGIETEKEKQRRKNHFPIISLRASNHFLKSFRGGLKSSTEREPTPAGQPPPRHILP